MALFNSLLESVDPNGDLNLFPEQIVSLQNRFMDALMDTDQPLPVRGELEVLLTQTLAEETGNV